MHLLLLAAILPSFSLPDSSAWRWRLELSATGPIEIPGKEDFYEPEGRIFDVSDPRSRAGSGSFRIALHTPERRNWNAHAAASVGSRSKTWEGVVVNSLFVITGIPSSDATRIESRMTATAPVLELATGVEYRMSRRHFLGVEVVLPIQLADGDLTYEVEGETIHSGKAPSSFREAVMPRLMATYDYRLFDRIDLGLGFSFLHGDYFARTPEADIDNVGRIRLEHGSTGPWLELHAGWTFGRAKP